MSDHSHSQEDTFAGPKTGRQRYYFDTDDGERVIRDEEGVEFESLDEAQAEAARALSEIVKDALPDGMRRDFVMVVRDAGGEIVLRATLALTVERLV